MAEKRLSSTGEALKAVLLEMVEEPDRVLVREKRRGDKVRLEVNVASGDMGAVIGRGGRTASALRELLDTRSGSFGEKYELKILEPEDRP
ncbi:MAG: KH domain-containing protein [Thermoanaerobaculia bacterium]|nr:KH domain-containing protein [Thermoanaerobaculia bacterium]